MEGSGKLNKKLIVAVAVVGVLAVSLLASAFAFGWFKKQEKPEVKTEQKTAIKTEKVKKSAPTESEKGKLSPEAERALRDADYAYEQAQTKIKAYEEKYGDLIYLKLPRQDNEKFCTGMLKDFKEGKGIEVIKPDIQTDDFEGKELKPYWDKCPKFLQTKRVIGRDGYGEYAKVPVDLNEFDIAKSGHYTSHFGYKLYDIDFDNDNKEPSHNVFYQAGLYKEPAPKNRYYDVYQVIDFINCEISGMKFVYSIVNYEVSNDTVIDDYSGLKVHKTIEKETVKPTKSVNGVIKYKDEYYIYNLNQYENSKFVDFIYFMKWEPYFNGTTKVNVKQKCIFRRNLKIKEEK